MYMWILSAIVVLVPAWVDSAEKIKLRRSDTAIPSDICIVGYSYTKFNYKTQYCCDGVRSSIKPKPAEGHIPTTAGEQLCCNDILPNRTQVECCNTRRIPVAPLKKAACCDIYLYNVELEFCHNKHIFNIFPTSTVIRQHQDYTSTVKLEIVERHRDTSGISTTYLIIVVFCTVLLCIVVLAITFTIILRRRKLHSYKNLSTANSVGMERNTQNLIEDIPSSCILPETLETDAPGFENIEYIDMQRLKSKPRPSQNFINDNWNDNAKMVPETVLSSKRTQTENGKIINVRNVMGKQFDAAHVFDKNNRSLVLPHSAAKLTLSEEDVSSGQIECYATTYRNLKDIYEVFQKHLKDDEEIVSPTIEYFFPRNKTLQKFASVEMDYYNCGCNKTLNVFRFESDVEHGGILRKEQIPRMQTGDTKNANAFYELISPGKIRIYLKSFCTLMCTVCHGEHDSLTLTAHAYVVSLPRNSETKHVRVTLYILAGVSQLTDYVHGLSQFVNTDEQQIRSPPKRISLPRRVQLEDDLGIRLKLWPDSRDIWQQCPFSQDLDDIEKVQLHNIVSCPRHNSNGSPYFKEWNFENNPSLIHQYNDKLQFQCTITTAMEQPHPGVDTRAPPKTDFSITHEIDITNIKKHGQSPPPGGGIQPSPMNFPHENIPIQQHSRTVETGRPNDHIRGMPHFQSHTTGAHGNENVRDGPTVRNRMDNSDANNQSKYPADRGNLRQNENHNIQSPNHHYGARPKERHQKANYKHNRKSNHDDQEANKNVVFGQIPEKEAPVNKRTPPAASVRAETCEESFNLED